MDLGSLRALALDLNLAAHGVDVTVTRPAPDDTPIATRGIWMTWITEDVPAASDFQRREPRKVMALSRIVVPTVPRGTLIVAPPPQGTGSVTQTWRVDGTERVEADHTRVFMVPAEDEG
jgi:hypothetical protein